MNALDRTILLLGIVRRELPCTERARLRLAPPMFKHARPTSLRALMPFGTTVNTDEMLRNRCCWQIASGCVVSRLAAATAAIIALPSESIDVMISVIHEIDFSSAG